MAYIPMDKTGKQAYPHDPRPWHVKVKMWFWEKVLIPLFGTTHRGKTFQLQLITGEKTKYLNCTFIRCKFENLYLVFIHRCHIKYQTKILNISNAPECSIRNCSLEKVDPISEKKDMR